ncbi:MAG: 50S ribosomal protein L21 [Chloroflexota bacterium]
MLAVVEIAGQQFQVEPGMTLTAPRIEGAPGDELTFGNILFAIDGEKTQIGAPYIQGSVAAKILAHGKGDKVIVFHKKRRKGYRKLNGYRSQFTQIEITNVNI